MTTGQDRFSQQDKAFKTLLGANLALLTVIIKPFITHSLIFVSTVTMYTVIKTNNFKNELLKSIFKKDEEKMALYICITTHVMFGDSSVESLDAFVAEKKAMNRDNGITASDIWDMLTRPTRGGLHSIHYWSIWRRRGNGPCKNYQSGADGERRR